MRKIPSKSKPNKKLKREKESEDEEIDENLEFEDPIDDEYESDENAIYHSGSSLGEAEEWEDFENLRLEDSGTGDIKLVADPSYRPMEEEKSSKPPKET